jgi:transposase InsO family protein
MLDMIFAIVTSLRHLLGWIVSAFRSREDLILENLALRQQLVALHAKRPRRRLTALHKLFWIALKTFWSGWTKPLVLVTPRSHPTRTAFRSPWQNGVAERWVGTCRRDLLDHVIVLNEQHLKRLLSEYVRHYHEDRTHLGLAKDTPSVSYPAPHIRRP